MISVVIPLYNKAASIEKTLESVFAQTYKDYEIVIVDDGSTDDSAAIVERMNDARIRLIRQENAGVSSARNRGIKEARGEYVALLDGDDEWEADYLSTQASMIEKYPFCKVFITSYKLRKNNGENRCAIVNGLDFEEDGVLKSYFKIASQSEPPCCSINIVSEKKCFETIGGFPTGIRSGEDLLTWARLAVRYKIAYNRRPLAIFNVEGYNVQEPPKRVPAEEDIVGRELKALAHDFNPPHIREYISLWHKMRSSVYMRLGKRRKSIREALKGLRYNPLNYKLYVYIGYNLLPQRIKRII